MKYIIVLADGMADEPLAALGGKTPMQAARKPRMDALANRGRVGRCRTVPAGMKPGSDVANMAVMGFDPARYYSGRSPLEAVALGIDLAPTDVTYRANLVCLSDGEKTEDCMMADYSAGEISTAEARELIEALQPLLPAGVRLYPGISYRHCLVLANGKTGADLTPPHDISGQSVRGYLPQGQNAALLRDLLERSRAVLRDHPVNLARREKGLAPANSLWFWGEGTRPQFDTLERLYGVRGGVVCAVDLIRGLGRCAGLRTVDVPGATGGMTTNYRGKAEAALGLLRDGCDFVYIHIEAPDECGHHGDVAAKIKAIEAIDRDVVGFLADALAGEAFRMLVTPDHPTPIRVMTHTADPVPFLLYDSTRAFDGPETYDEQTAQAAGRFLEEGPMLMKALLENNNTSILTDNRL